MHLSAIHICGYERNPAFRIHVRRMEDAPVTYGILFFVQVPLELKSSSTLGPKNGIFVKIQRRDTGEGEVNSPPDN